MKKYLVYIDDGKNCMKLAIPAKNESQARKYVEGNGEIIAIKDVTQEWQISADKLYTTLRNAHYGAIEIDFIIRTLTTENIIQ